MIFDNMTNFDCYYGLGEKFKKGFDFLSNTDLKNLENGRYEIDGDEIFVSVQDYSTKPLSEGKFEAHKIYADIQFIIKGEERLGFGNVTNFTPITAYDETNDIVFLDGKGDFVGAKEGDFLVFFPQDAHMPCICVDNSRYVKKAVVKIKI